MRIQLKIFHLESKQYLLNHHSEDLQNKQMVFHFVNYKVKLNPNIKQQILNDLKVLKKKKDFFNKWFIKILKKNPRKFSFPSSSL
jgi:hypothetical protein